MSESWLKFQSPIIGNTILVYNKDRSISFEIPEKKLNAEIKKKLNRDKSKKIYAKLEYEETDKKINFTKIIEIVTSDQPNYSALCKSF